MGIKALVPLCMLPYETNSMIKYVKFNKLLHELNTRLAKGSITILLFFDGWELIFVNNQCKNKCYSLKFSG